MITYVNTVLVSNKNGAQLATTADLTGVKNKADLQNIVGKFVFMNCDPTKQDGSAITDICAFDPECDTFRIGVITNNHYTRTDADGALLFIPIVKWSNEIKAADIKSITKLDYTKDSEDTITVDFNSIDSVSANVIANGGAPVVLRLTFKDMPTRFRNWTESYDYISKWGDTGEQIAAGLAEAINLQKRRARVYASANAGVLKLTAMEYDDDNSNESENFTGKVRFNANCWYCNPFAAGFASNNKYAIGVIKKIVGVQYPASGKNVRDHERTAQGYQGIMHRCCWFDPKPAITANIDYQYDGITLEFENMYRAADDIFRKTKQTVEIYASDNGEAAGSTTIAGGLLANLQAMLAVRQKPVASIDNKAAYNPSNFEAGK